VIADWSVTLRHEHRGHDERILKARWFDDTGLVLEGHDLGPGTRMVSDDGEYEYRFEIPTASIPELLRLLGAAEDADLETVLRKWTGARSHEFERLCWGLRTNFWCWP
jgi:hypothetical protein